MPETFTGGYQCGAVRFRATGPIRHASICNCRMCQKALGNFIAPFVSFEGPVEWTRGRPTEFRSSQNVRRGFCRDCGTPLSYRWGDHEPSLTIGAFDDPDAIMPTIEFAHDNRHPIFAHYEMHAEPQGSTDEERDLLAILRSFQHPDHDTETWTPSPAP
jgi:hypothetical protein